MTRGALIVFEGAEGVGKTTQVRRLVAALAEVGIPHLHQREPGGTSVGESIRQLLLDPTRILAPTAETLLFLASRAQLVSDRIRPALENGDVVVLDRFFVSTYAYQIAGRGLDEHLVRAANQLAVSDVVPDVTLLMDLPVVEGLARTDARGTRDRMEQAGDDFHQRVGLAFAQFMTSQWQDAHPECGPIVCVNAQGSEDEVFARVVDVLISTRPEMFNLLATPHTKRFLG